MARYTVAKAAEFGDPDTRGFDIDRDDERRRLFVVRQAGHFHAYLNSCPHTGGPLNWTADQFLSRDRRYIQCSLHGALFRIDNGRCIAGPCAGDCLTPITARVVNDTLIVELPD